MTVERNSNIKYTSAAIHGQKGKVQQTLPPLPNTLPSQVQVKLSDYAPLENPEKALALAMRLKEIQERGEEVLLITRNEEIEELNRMRETTTDREQAEWAIAAPLVIPEIDELERRLAGVSEDDVDGKRTVIREWVRGLNGTGSLKPLDEEGQAKRRRSKDVEIDIITALGWLERLYPIFISFDGQVTNPMTASNDYGIAYQVLTRGIDRGYITQIGEEGRKTLIDAKSTALVATLHRRFGGFGNRIVPSVMKEYYLRLA